MTKPEWTIEKAREIVAYFEKNPIAIGHRGGKNSLHDAKLFLQGYDAALKEKGDKGHE